MNRRTFVHSLTASLAGASLLPRLRPTATRLDRVGLDVYRRPLESERGLAIGQAYHHDNAHRLVLGEHCA